MCQHRDEFCDACQEHLQQRQEQRGQNANPGPGLISDGLQGFEQFLDIFSTKPLLKMRFFAIDT